MYNYLTETNMSLAAITCDLLLRLKPQQLPIVSSFARNIKICKLITSIRESFFCDIWRQSRLFNAWRNRGVHAASRGEILPGLAPRLFYRAPLRLRHRCTSGPEAASRNTTNLSPVYETTPIL